MKEAGSLSTEMLRRIASSKDEIQECGHVLHETSALLQEYDIMIFELIEEIASLHLQISQTRLFITREVNNDSDIIRKRHPRIVYQAIAHHDTVAMGLSPEELSKMQELNAFQPSMRSATVR